MNIRSRSVHEQRSQITVTNRSQTSVHKLFTNTFTNNFTNNITSMLANTVQEPFTNNGTPLSARQPPAPTMLREKIAKCQLLQVSSRVQDSRIIIKCSIQKDLTPAIKATDMLAENISLK